MYISMHFAGGRRIGGDGKQHKRKGGGRVFLRNRSVLLVFLVVCFPCDPIVFCFANVLEMVCSQPRCQRRSVFLSHVCGMLFLFMNY